MSKGRGRFLALESNMDIVGTVFFLAWSDDRWARISREIMFLFISNCVANATNLLSVLKREININNGSNRQIPRT